MNSPPIKHLNPRSIYTVLVISFISLLTLIVWIGASGASKLNKGSRDAGDSANDYMSRLKLAHSIREAAAEVVAEARVYRAKLGMKVPIPPFEAKLRSAKKRFYEQIEKGRVLWSKREKHATLTERELSAWRSVETASLNFMTILDEIEHSTEGQINTPEEDQSDQNDFLTGRHKLHEAAKTLTEAVSQAQNNILRGFSNQQQTAATEVSHTTVGTFLVGLFVATFTIILARNQIGQLRQANRQEQEAKDFARSIFDSQSNDILVVNNKGELLAVNKAFLDHFQLPAPSLVLQDFRAALAHLPEVAAFVGRTLEQSDDRSSLRERIEVRPYYGQNDQDLNATEARLFDVYISPLTIGGLPGGRVVVIVDVTEAEKVREELRRSRTLSAVGQITATVAHELYNPIGAVKLNLDLLEMQISGDGDLKHTVARLKRGVEHLSTIVMDLRYLTRPRDPEPRIIDLNKLLDEVVELASDRLERSRVCIARNYAQHLPRGQFDPQQLRKVFLNLLINAVEASPQNSDVELQTRYLSPNGTSAPSDTNGTAGELVISVIDRGVGMSDETKRRLFEAFYTTKSNGTGLGMMITQEIVKKHGGKIEVESEEGTGTTVSVYLPV